MFLLVNLSFSSNKLNVLSATAMSKQLLAGHSVRRQTGFGVGHERGNKGKIGTSRRVARKQREHTRVKMSQAAVNKQLDAGRESCSIGDNADETPAICSLRVAGGERMKTLDDVNIWTNDVELLP